MELTPEQQLAYEQVTSGKNLFLTGPGGTGKTTLIHRVSTNLEDKVIGVTATTGAAAVLIGGTTLHSFLGIGLGKEPIKDLVRKIRRKSAIKKHWTKTDLLIIDEVSMLSKALFEKLEAMARILRDDQRSFGGIQLLFTGDFCQLPCIDGEFCFKSDAWTKCFHKVIYLQTIIRQTDVVFQECLNRARMGAITDEDLKMLYDSSNTSDPTIKPTKILCYNEDVNAINQMKLEKLPADKRYTYELEVEVEPEYEGKLHIDPVKWCNAQVELQLAIGAQVMLLVNLDFTAGLVNGSRGVVVAFENGVPMVKFNRITRPIDYHEWEVTENKVHMASIFQIPLKLAYAITVHKSQGLTLDCATIDLHGVFEYGQAYVALSRVKNLESLKIINVSKKSFKVHPSAKTFYDSL